MLLFKAYSAESAGVDNESNGALNKHGRAHRQTGSFGGTSLRSKVFNEFLLRTFSEPQKRKKISQSVSAYSLIT